MRIIFLGTAGTFPTIHRNLPSIAIRRKGETLLFDCGEGTQRQMLKAKLGFCNKVFITHMHGDHILGLPGLLQTMSLFQVGFPLKIFGPEGIANFINNIKKLVKCKITFPVIIKEIGEGEVCREKEYSIKASWMDHTIPNLGYALIEYERPGKFYPEKAISLGVPEGPLWFSLQHGNDVKLANGELISPRYVVDPPRKGRKIVYSGDTRPCEAILNLAKDADLLIYDATLDDGLMDKANIFGHSSPSQGALIAKKANVKRLVLTHISGRYNNAELLVHQAQNTFPNTDIVEDLVELKVLYPK